MRRVLGLALALAGVLSTGACSVSSEHELGRLPSSEAGEAATEAQLRSITERTIAALKAGDRAFFERLLADDYVGTAVDGRVIDRARFFATFQPPPPEMNPEFEVVDVRIRTREGVAILNARRNFRGQVDGRPIRQSERTTQTYVREGGRWRLLAEHSAPLAADAP